MTAEHVQGDEPLIPMRVLTLDAVPHTAPRQRLPDRAPITRRLALDTGALVLLCDHLC